VINAIGSTRLMTLINSSRPNHCSVPDELKQVSQLIEYCVDMLIAIFVSLTIYYIADKPSSDLALIHVSLNFQSRKITYLLIPVKNQPNVHFVNRGYPQCWKL